mgnify:CR=1
MRFSCLHGDYIIISLLSLLALALHYKICVLDNHLKFTYHTNNDQIYKFVM